MTHAPEANPRPRSIRTSVTFPVEIYSAIEKLAKQQKVSAAWLIREAAEQYVSAQWPLLDKTNSQL